MERFKVLLLFFSLQLFCFGFAGTPLKIGVITDLHYLSQRLMDNGYAVDDYVLTTGKDIKVTPQVVDSVLAYYLRSDIKYLFICGDLTKDGELESHQDLSTKLKPLKDKGIKIFVIPGNHDINMPNAVGFIGNKTFKTKTVSPTEFSQIYKDYGYSNAYMRDTASLSYVSQLTDSTWLLAIDAARYEEYVDKSISSGHIKQQTEKWIDSVLDKALQLNVQVIGMMHWGVTEHIMYQSMFFGDYLVSDWQRLADKLADKGVKAIFTGHFHSNDISAHTSSNGNTIYDVETGTLSSFPFSYRFIELDRSGMKIETEFVTSTSSYPDLLKNSKAKMRELAHVRATNMLKSKNIILSDSVVIALSDVLADIFVKHMQGDEQLDEGLKSKIEKMALSVQAPVDVTDIELDFYPADNNVYIKF